MFCVQTYHARAFIWTRGRLRVANVWPPRVHIVIRWTLVTVRLPW